MPTSNLKQWRGIRKKLEANISQCQRQVLKRVPFQNTVFVTGYRMSRYITFAEFNRLVINVNNSASNTNISHFMPSLQVTCRQLRRPIKPPPKKVTYQYHQVSHKACNQHNLWLQLMLKRSMELDADWQEENAAMMGARSSLQTPSKFRLKKKKQTDNQVWTTGKGEETCRKILSTYHKRP